MRRTAAILGILLASAAMLAAEHVPVTPPFTVLGHVRSLLLLDGASLDGLAEVEGTWQVDGMTLGERAVTLGGYWRPVPNLKLGAFWRLQAGVRHDDDWIDLAPGWEWQDTSGRWESLFMVDASPRIVLPFLPGGDWTGTLRVRWQVNAANGEQSLLVRPSLAWFLLAGREPVLSATLSWDLYAPLNFGTTLLYEQYPYLVLLWYATPALLVEAGAAYRTVTWSPSDDFLAAHPTETYAVSGRSLVVGAGVVVRLGLR